VGLAPVLPQGQQAIKAVAAYVYNGTQM